MIKFFRKIRFNLIGTKETGKYFKYAIGEILLVMIGILLALQVNNWNTEKQNRHVERNYLKNLKADLEVDLNNLDSLSKDRTKKAESAFKLLKLPGATSIKELISLDSLYYNVFVWTSFIPRTTTRQELISSGQFNLIHSDRIKALILILNQQNDQIVVQREHMRREYDHYLYDRTTANRTIFVGFDFETSIKTGEKILDATLTNAQLDLYFNETEFIQNDRVIENGLKLAAGNNLFLKGLYEKMKQDIEVLIKLINEDLNLNS
jgi:hypothetical protein